MLRGHIRGRGPGSIENAGASYIVRRPYARPGADLIDFAHFLGINMAERDDDHFDLDDEFVADAEEEQSFDRFIDRDKRVRPGTSVKKGRAAWSKLEDVLADRRLQKELKDFDEEV